MVLSNFLSRQGHADINTHEIIPISFNIQGIFQSKYYNIGEEKIGKYLVQTRSQAKSSGIRIPEVHGRDKGASEAKGTSKIKPRIGQGRAGLRQKIKSPIPLPINKPIVKLTERPKEQSNVALKVLTSECPIIKDKITPEPVYAIPQTRSGDDPSSRMVKRKLIHDVSREIPMYPDLVYRPLLN